MDEEYHGVHKRLVERLGEARGDAVYTFVACLLALWVSGLAAYLLGQPLLFPSLGPTAFLFFETPMGEKASPRNTVMGHFVAVLAGVSSLAVFGLLDDPSILEEGVTFARAGAAALSVALTGGVQLLLRASHPPADATTLILNAPTAKAREIPCSTRSASVKAGLTSSPRALASDRPGPSVSGSAQKEELGFRSLRFGESFRERPSRSNRQDSVINGQCANSRCAMEIIPNATANPWLKRLGLSRRKPVSLGFLQTPREMVALMAGVMLLTAAGWGINRLFGTPMPMWSSKR